MGFSRLMKEGKKISGFEQLPESFGDALTVKVAH
jgi:hypothetical protein